MIKQTAAPNTTTAALLALTCPLPLCSDESWLDFASISLSRNQGEFMTSENSVHRQRIRFERAIARRINPLVIRLTKLFGVSNPLVVELETTGRKSGQVRRTPLSAQFDDTGAWLISQHGARSGWAANVAANPNVRLRQGNKWHTGVAELRPDDDAVARARNYGKVGGKLTQAASTQPISVRVEFTD